MNYTILKSTKEISDYIAAKLAQLQNKVTAEGRIASVALSGGSTPQAIFKDLAEREGIEWSSFHFYWVDERCVPFDSSESNYGNAKKILFDKVDIPADNIHPMDCTKPLSAYVSKIKEHVSFVNIFPSFDLILLGMGDDGHTASLFPNRLDLTQSQDICIFTTHPESKQKRMTLTYETINYAKDICFIVTGEKKAKIVSDIFNSKPGYKKYPASHISNKAVWVLDEAAAKEI